MRNKIALYIGGRRADLDDGSFILLNYTAEDLTNPTIVRNSFSRQITLKGTPTNNAIFGDIYRNDRVTQYGGGTVGPDFDPTRKTPFTIYNEAGEILEDGYLKLDKVTRTRRSIEYSVTLYGGLGSFLYGLSYDADGNKRTLASLNYGQTLDFTINRTQVRNAWARLNGSTSYSAKWDVINFAPAYTGIPSGEFDADKAVFHAATAGLKETDGEYSTISGYVLASLNQEVTGQEAKDYRSYLQKPVLRMKALINAICDPANNGGYTVNLDPEFFTDTNPYWDKTWLTLPLLTDLNIDVNTDGGVFYVAPPTTFTVPDQKGGNISTLYSFDMNFGMSYASPSGTTGRYVMHLEDDWAAGQQGDDSPGFYLNYILFTVRAYDANGNSLGTTEIRASTADWSQAGVSIDFVFDYIDVETGNFYKNGEIVRIPVRLSGYGINNITVSLSIIGTSWGNTRYNSANTMVWPESSYNYDDGVDASANPYSVNLYQTECRWSMVSAATVRTGAYITKRALLSSEHTPADYLLSFCKMFGLQLVAHKGEKVVDILLRKNLYTGEVVDINGRIDRGKPIEKVPFAFDARWYLFGNEAAGDYADYYANKYGRPYGQFRVNTGYGFDASERSMTDGIIFRNAVPVTETSKFFCDLTLNELPIPAVFLGGGKYTLFKGGGESEDLPIPFPTTAGKTWWDPSNPMHDTFPKVQFHGKENEPVDERDTLLLFNGFQAPGSSYVALTDDIREMLQLNGNTPCWLPDYAAYYPTWRVASLPWFCRFTGTKTSVVKSLEFGTPAEMQIPDISVPTSAAVYSQYWDKYIADRYDDDSAVVTAYVDLRGMQVNEQLLRRFYAFDGAVWALNRIIDYSLTTFGPTKCEFVKVQDITNYTTL